MTIHEANTPAHKADEAMLVTAGLASVEKLMTSITSSEIEVLRDASKHILGAGGKRVRPRLLMLAYIAAGGTDVDYAAAPAAAVELMHTASVVHDDINDHGVVRRGRPSVNAIWGRTFALLTGDFLFTTVYRLMASYGDINEILSRAATALVEGETLQAHAVKTSNFTRETYARIIALKTAALFEAAGEMGARLANADKRTIDALKLFGFNVGLAFQIVDDILDIVGDEAILGKTSGIDIEQGRGFASAKDESAEEDDVMNTIKRKMMAGNRLEEAKTQSHQLIEVAIQAIDFMPESEAKAELIDLAYQVINRDH